MQKHYAISIHILGCITTRYKFLILPWQWQERAAVKPGRRHLVACLDKEVVGHLALDIMETPGAATLPLLVLAFQPKNRGAALAVR
jgi:predicted N-acetyltransferase YhbS